MMSSFGPEFESIWPKAGAALKFTDFGRKLIRKCQDVKKPDNTDIDIKKFIKKSSNFPVEFGTNTCRIMSQPKDRYPIIQQQIGSAYPILHERALGLYLSFLEHKCQFGNSRELKVYSNLTLTDFVDRLLRKRCVAFLGRSGAYLLVTGEEGQDPYVDIGTESEKKPLLLENVMSFDENKLSAFLSVSSHSEFINNGTRLNGGVIEEDKSKIERDGVVIGLIGGFFSRPRYMEYQDIVITNVQNTKENGYGADVDATAKTRAEDYRRVWKQFYEEKDYLFDKVKMDGKRFKHSSFSNCFFDNVIMKKRYTISFDTLLLESEARAAATGKQAYIHVVGIGLGVWRVADQQEQIFLETFTQRLKHLIPKLSHISVVHFSWFHMTECGELKDGGIIQCETHPEGGIRTFLFNRNPADKLSPEHENKLIIASYAWDGNALPGNEFWFKSLTSSGDPAAACSTLITELHNPHINKEMVSGQNLHIASEKYGVLHISEYAKKMAV